jgi:hypothetical protein
MKGSRSEMKGRINRKEDTMVQSQDKTRIRKPRAVVVFTDIVIAKADSVVKN